jgi:hypothetical protein
LSENQRNTLFRPDEHRYGTPSVANIRLDSIKQIENDDISCLKLLKRQTRNKLPSLAMKQQSSTLENVVIERRSNIMSIPPTPNKFKNGKQKAAFTTNSTLDF